VPPATTSSQLDYVFGLAAEGEPIIAPSGSDPIVEAVAAAMRNDRAQAAAALQAAERSEPYDPVTWEVASVLLSHWGDDATRAMAVATFLRNAPLTMVAGGPAPVTYEIGSLHIIPRDELVREAQRLLPSPPWPWALERLLPPSR